MRAWRARNGAGPSSYDWSRTHAPRRGGEALKRLETGEWSAPSTVIDLYGSWAAAVADAFGGAWEEFVVARRAAGYSSRRPFC
jgi:hypothetical protein